MLSRGKIDLFLEWAHTVAKECIKLKYGTEAPLANSDGNTKLVESAADAAVSHVCHRLLYTLNKTLTYQRRLGFKLISYIEE